MGAVSSVDRVPEMSLTAAAAVLRAGSQSRLLASLGELRGSAGVPRCQSPAYGLVWIDRIATWTGPGAQDVEHVTQVLGAERAVLPKADRGGAGHRASAGSSPHHGRPSDGVQQGPLRQALAKWWDVAVGSHSSPM